MNKTVFYQHISKTPEKKLLFDKAYDIGLIKEFDQGTMTKLRKLYFSCLSGILYLFGEETSISNIGNKILLLTHALENEEFELVHGETNSTREIMFSQYGQEHLDFNSWIEVKKGNKTWIYDPFSLLMFSKDIYYKLEEPDLIKKIPKIAVISHPSREEDDFFKMSDEWLLPEFLPKYEIKAEKSPYKDLLKTEIMRIKNKANYDDIKLNIYKEFVELGQKPKK